MCLITTQGDRSSGEGRRVIARLSLSLSLSQSLFSRNSPAGVLRVSPGNRVSSLLAPERAIRPRHQAISTLLLSAHTRLLLSLFAI